MDTQACAISAYLKRYAKEYNMFLPKDVNSQTTLDAFKIALGGFLKQFPERQPATGYTPPNSNSLLSTGVLLEDMEGPYGGQRYSRSPLLQGPAVLLIPTVTGPDTGPDSDSQLSRSLPLPTPLRGRHGVGQLSSSLPLPTPLRAATGWGSSPHAYRYRPRYGPPQGGAALLIPTVRQLKGGGDMNLGMKPDLPSPAPMTTVL
ncbi:unnamed protein product [Boreogadus saida]